MARVPFVWFFTPSIAIVFVVLQFLSDKNNIKEVLLFPAMKPQASGEGESVSDRSFASPDGVRFLDSHLQRVQGPFIHGCVVTPRGSMPAN